MLNITVLFMLIGCICIPFGIGCVLHDLGTQSHKYVRYALVPIGGFCLYIALRYLYINIIKKAFTQSQVENLAGSLIAFARIFIPLSLCMLAYSIYKNPSENDRKEIFTFACAGFLMTEIGIYLIPLISHVYWG